MHCVPKEFVQLSMNAAESRRRTESLYTRPADPLPITVLHGDHRRPTDSDSGTAASHGGCGRVDVLTHSATAGQGDTATTLSSGKANPGTTSDGSEAADREVRRPDGGCDDLPTPATGFSSPNAAVAAAAKSCEHSFVAAGHEVTMMCRQKQSKDDKRSKQQTTSTKLQQREPHQASTSTRCRQQAQCLTQQAPGPSTGAVADPGPGERSVVDQFDNIGQHRVSGELRQPHRRSNHSSAAVEDGTEVAGGDGSPSTASLQSDFDVGPTSPADDCDVFLAAYSDHAAGGLSAGDTVSAGGHSQRDAVSPGHRQCDALGLNHNQSDSVTPGHRQCDSVIPGVIPGHSQRDSVSPGHRQCDSVIPGVIPGHSQRDFVSPGHRQCDALGLNHNQSDSVTPGQSLCDSVSPDVSPGHRLCDAVIPGVIPGHIQRDSVSPGRSDAGEAECSQRRGGVGRGQLLRMMLTANHH